VRTAAARAAVVLEPEEAATLWRDVGRWPTFVEGFARALDVSPGWPDEGTRVVWESIPSGRGRVTEKVVATGDRRFATRVFEERLQGTQTVRFEPSPDGEGSLVEVRLEYGLARPGPLGAVADALFIRRALRDALRRTLSRFAVEAEEERGLR
jgi:uncharacterized membrane protein